jgi:hypothetical protein
MIAAATEGMKSVMAKAAPIYHKRADRSTAQARKTVRQHCRQRGVPACRQRAAAAAVSCVPRGTGAPVHSSATASLFGEKFTTSKTGPSLLHFVGFVPWSGRGEYYKLQAAMGAATEATA